MTVARINRAIAAVDRSVTVTHASFPFVLQQRRSGALTRIARTMLKSMFLEWPEGTIYIVELGSLEHQIFTRRSEWVFTKQPAFHTFMAMYGSSGIMGIPNCRSFKQTIATVLNVKRGLPCQNGVSDFPPLRSLVVQIGHWRGWGTGVGFLDWKAQQWTRIPGLRFILCVVVTDRLASAEYKLYTVERNAQTNEADPLPDLAPVRVEAPHTMVKFDSRELLGLPPGAVIPQDDATGEQFPDQTLTLTCMRFL